MITINSIVTWISEDFTNSYYFVKVQLEDGSIEVVECQTFEDVESLVEDVIIHNSAFGYMDYN